MVAGMKRLFTVAIVLLWFSGLCIGLVIGKAWL